jgi:bifunctional non-homologous end joining protein LigD
VQKHAARRLHYDFRLELDGVLKSWAVPKGPSLVAGARRMAVATEDHPLDYATFEGVIPKGEYGGGTVQLWDHGSWEPLDDPHAALAKGDLSFRLNGSKLRGRWHLVRMRARAADRGRSHWLLIKGRDAEARSESGGDVTEREPRSVTTGRALEEIARDADRVWSSDTGERKVKPARSAGAGKAPGAKRAALPARIEFELATLVDAPPTGDEWLHEIKLDGYRLAVRIERGRVQLFTRGGKDWTDTFPRLAEAAAALPVDRAWLDGEAVVFDAEGRTRFQLLQNAQGGTGAAGLQLVVFDLLHLDGSDLRGAPLVERKRLLQELLARAPKRLPLRFGQDVRGRGDAFFREACKRGVEGIVSKRADAPHRAGRTRAWLKVKCLQRQEFVVVGFTEPGGSRVGLGALLVGAHDATGKLRYCGKVGTGFAAAQLAALRARLDALAQDDPPVIDPKRAERGAHWTAPRLVAEIEFTEWTGDGKLRHPVFVGIREDKRPKDVRIETEQPVEEVAAASPALRTEVAGVRLSHPDRVYWPDVGVTKSELAQYYEAVADRILPGLRDRPLTMLRCPAGVGGERFFQKHAGDTVSSRVARVTVRRGEAPYAMVTDLPSLVSLVQIGVLELHVWGARADRLDRPDLVVFDLDPDPAVPWSRVAGTAKVFRSTLADLGFVPFVRTTGGKGLHVVVPLVRRAGWDEVKRFARSLAELFAAEAPDFYTAVMSKQRREGKIYIDYLRNAPEATAIASWSTRARPGAPIAMPLAWDELDEGAEQPRFVLRDAPARLAARDPWRDFEASRRPLSASILQRVGAVER